MCTNMADNNFVTSRENDLYFELLKVGVDPQIFHSHNEKLFNCDPPWDFSE